MAALRQIVVPENLYSGRTAVSAVSVVGRLYWALSLSLLLTVLTVPKNSSTVEIKSHLVIALQ